MNKEEKQQIKYLLDNLKWYAEAPNEQDYNGEYEPQEIQSVLTKEAFESMEYRIGE